MLYFGYVGLAVPFAFAVAALLEGKLDASWARWVRPWTTVAWIFLTVGITLGSWWAYYELGWGGWWFWDPVENSSFMPWLVGTALIHSLAVTEKRGLFKSWTLLLAIFAFSLSLLGTFLTRSGVLISVHSFASDPRRGLFILAFLCVCIGSALTLYAWRAHKFRSDVGFAVSSRESFLLVNNVLLVAAAGLILLGTLYPLFLDAMNLGKLSVGPSYFDAVFLVPMFPLIFILGIGMHAGWKRADFSALKNLFVLIAGVALLVALFVPWMVYGSTSVLTVVGITASLWVAGTALIEPIKRLRAGHTLSPAVVGMCVAHFGLAFFVFGVTVLKSYDEERDLSLRPGESAQVGEYEFKLLGLQDVQGPNYKAVQGDVTIAKAGKQVALLHPQKRAYRVQASVLTEAGIDPAINRDLIVSMGDQIGQAAWSMRIQYKPMIRFIWLGSLVMALGGFIAVLDRRYRTAPATVTAPAAALAAK
jgi:cytochrome c-type biogenesis protein CcmF